MSERFYSATPVAGEHTVLDGPEAHHLIHVMRCGVGDRVVVFDGSGWEFDCQVEQSGRREVRLAVLGKRSVDRETTYPLVLGVALPKGDRQKTLVEKLTELGATRLVPLRTARGVAEPAPAALERLRRVVVEASKQCGRSRLLEIGAPLPLAEFLANPGVEPEGLRLFAHPGEGPTPGELIGGCERRGVAVAVGPEGGFTGDEAAMALRACWQAVGLGPRVLRVETAATALAALATAPFSGGESDPRRPEAGG